MDPSAINLESLGVSGIVVALLLYWNHTIKQDCRDLRSDVAEAWAYNRDRDLAYQDDLRKITATMIKQETAITLLREAIL